LREQNKILLVHSFYNQQALNMGNKSREEAQRRVQEELSKGSMPKASGTHSSRFSLLPPCGSQLPIYEQKVAPDQSFLE
jgi:hypothetical protein